MPVTTRRQKQLEQLGKRKEKPIEKEEDNSENKKKIKINLDNPIHYVFFFAYKNPERMKELKKTIFTEEELKNYGMRDLIKILTSAPGVSVSELNTLNSGSFVPKEILSIIFQFLPFKDGLNFGLTQKFMYRIFRTYFNCTNYRIEYLPKDRFYVELKENDVMGKYSFSEIVEFPYVLKKKDEVCLRHLSNVFANDTRKKCIKFTTYENLGYKKKEGEKRSFYVSMDANQTSVVKDNGDIVLEIFDHPNEKLKTEHLSLSDFVQEEIKNKKDKPIFQINKKKKLKNKLKIEGKQFLSDEIEKKEKLNFERNSEYNFSLSKRKDQEDIRRTMDNNIQTNTLSKYTTEKKDSFITFLKNFFSLYQKKEVKNSKNLKEEIEFLESRYKPSLKQYEGNINYKDLSDFKKEKTFKNIIIKIDKNGKIKLRFGIEGNEKDFFTNHKDSEIPHCDIFDIVEPEEKKIGVRIFFKKRHQYEIWKIGLLKAMMEEDINKAEEIFTFYNGQINLGFWNQTLLEQTLKLKKYDFLPFLMKYQEFGVDFSLIKDGGFLFNLALKKKYRMIEILIHKYGINHYNFSCCKLEIDSFIKCCIENRTPDSFFYMYRLLKDKRFMIKKNVQPVIKLAARNRQYKLMIALIKESKVKLDFDRNALMLLAIKNNDFVLLKILKKFNDGSVNFSVNKNTGINNAIALHHKELFDFYMSLDRKNFQPFAFGFKSYYLCLKCGFEYGKKKMEEIAHKEKVKLPDPNKPIVLYQGQSQILEEVNEMLQTVYFIPFSS